MKNLIFIDLPLLLITFTHFLYQMKIKKVLIKMNKKTNKST